MKETRLSRKEFNLLVNDILLDVKPIKLRISIANRLVEFFDKKQEQIAELEEQLKNAIMPKFKFMEKVWHINKDYFYKKDWYIEELLINGFEYKIDKRKNALVMWYSTYFNDYKNYKYQEKDLFTTKEVAEAKLKELQGK